VVRRVLAPDERLPAQQRGRHHKREVLAEQRDRIELGICEPGRAHRAVDLARAEPRVQVVGGAEEHVQRHVRQLGRERVDLRKHPAEPEIRPGAEHELDRDRIGGAARSAAAGPTPPAVRRRMADAN
jgi:hypothetical protein